MTKEEFEALKAQVLTAPMGSFLYPMFRAKTSDKDGGGFDVCADDEEGTYQVADFTEGGRKDDGTYWSNADKNRLAFIALWNAAPALFKMIEDAYYRSEQSDS